jgi:hypothetical protein
VIPKDLSKVARQIPAKACRIRNPRASKSRHCLLQNRQREYPNREQCKARTKAGGACQAPAVERGLCFFHAHPEKLAALGRQGGKKNRHGKLADCSLLQIPLKSIGDVSGLLEETINEVRRGQLEPRVANAMGYLTSVLLRSLEQGLVEERLAKIEAALAANAQPAIGA